MKKLCGWLMALTAAPMLFVGILSVIKFPKEEFDLRLIMGAILFSGALIGRCILETKKS